MPTLRDRLEALREKLLDLSFRNRMLNHSDTGRRILRVRRLSLAELYATLVEEGKTLTISAAPVETPVTVEAAVLLETPAPTETSIPPVAAGEGTGEPAPEPFEDAGEELTSELHRKVLPIAMRAAQLDNRLRTMHSQRRAMLDSTGSNLLYLALGFLEWHDPQNEPDKPRLSPLLLVPVEIERHLERIEESEENGDEAGQHRRPRMFVKIYRYTIRHDGEDVSSNLPLILRLRRSPFSLELESYESAEDSNTANEGSRFGDVDEYFAAVEQAVARLPSDVAPKPWRVIRAARVGFFTFFKEVIWRDLDPDRWPENSPLLEKEWIKAALEGREKISEPQISDGDVERAMHEEPLPTVLDADGTQMRALLRISHGESLVVQGPPGTGKSQTIANIIAIALSQGKTVLFMAEKLAALNVVKDRLDKAKIGQYCLELHSRQASVRAIHDQINKRLAISVRPPEPTERAEALKRLLRHRNGLNGNWDTLKQPIEGLGCSFWQTIWSAVWSREEFDEATGSIHEGAEFPAFQRGKSPGQDQLTAVVEQAETLCRLADDGVPERVRIWEGFHPTAVITQERIGAVRRILESSVTLAKGWSELDGKMFPTDLSGMTAARSLRLASSLPTNLAESWQQPLASGVAAGHSLANYDEYLSAMEAWRTHTDTHAVLLAEKPELTDEHLTVAHIACVEIAEKLPWLLTPTYARLRRAAEQLRELSNLAKLRAELAEKVGKALGLSGAPSTMADDSLLTKVVRLWVELGSADDCCLADCLASATTIDKLEAAEAEAHSLMRDEELLESWFRIRDAPPTEKIAWIRQTLSAAQGTWRAWWPLGKAATARKEVRAFLRSKQALKDTALCDFLNDLEVWPSRLEAFANSVHRRTLGPGFRGIKTDWKRLRRAALLAQTVVDWLGAAQARTLLGAAVRIADAVSAAEISADHLDECSREFADLLSKGAAGPCLNLMVQSRDAARELLGCLGASLNEPLAKIERVRPADDDELDAIFKTINSARKLRERRTRIEELVGKPTFLGVAHRGIHHTPLAPLRNTFEWIRKVIALHDLPAPCTAWLLETDSAQRLTQIRDATGTLVGAIEAWRATAEGLGSFAQIDSGSALAAANQERIASDVVTVFEEAIRAVGMLPQWADYVRVRKWFVDHQHGELLAFLSQHNLPVQMLAPLARAAFWEAWLRAAESMRPEAFGMARHEKETARNAFQSNDRKLLQQNCAFVSREVYIPRGAIAAGKQVGRAADLTNLALIDREIKKQKRHVPARELVRRSGRALQELMPCWMMGPGAVAQFLPAGRIEFDVLVVDEASQVRPEDSLGSLARAKQIVIVGDSKQMPPSDVFSVHVERDEDEEAEAGPAEELESVLDVFSRFLSAPSLGWHYRSQHHDLILYSNEFFYDRRLLIPPSTQIGDGPLGVKWEYCKDAHFTNRRNPVEAEAVVRLLSQHIIANANEPEDLQESIAVVTMSRTQQELIEELFDRKTKEWPDLASALERFKPSAPVIIRNLENIQGDERDVVIISFTYGPDVASGRVAQRFPLINRAGGWRRLNVLFSRSRLRTIVVSSMKSDQVLPRAERADDGVVHLRNYLRFAETGRLPDAPDGPRREPDSEFECSVGRVVQSLGFDVHFQVGTVGFLIDLAIPDPASPARYLCGIECDGAPYHSHPTARDRDRLREEILTARGWDIYRIWSTDWYRNRKPEIERLRGYLRQKAGLT